jgi:hypothetical protein
MHNSSSSFVQTPRLFARVRYTAFVISVLGITFAGGLFCGTVYESKIRQVTSLMRETLRLLPEPPHVVHTGDTVQHEIDRVIRDNENRKQWLQEQIRLNRFAYHRLRLQGSDGSSPECIQLVDENRAHEEELVNVATSIEAARRLSAQLIAEVPRVKSGTGAGSEKPLNDAVRWLAQNGSLGPRPTVSNDQWRKTEPGDRYMGMPE